MFEKRKSIRVATIMNAICFMGRGIKRTYDVRNISKEGALLLLDTPLNKGSELNLSMDVPGDNIPIFVSCSVAWQKESIMEPKKRMYETGVKFIEIDNPDKSRFFEYIYSQWIKLLERKR
ncbi:MAG: PilZ domain-containing protein [Candidatus Omnitrophota bacterium]|nr:PilZ domain-containing protein [Candidatus Omnitrophota bacterium]